MGEYRVGLRFSDSEEKDLNYIISELAESHRLSSFITNLIKIVYDSPELLNVAMTTKLGTITKARRAMLDEYDAKYKELSDRVDSLKAMCEDMYVLARIGKKIGLEERTENIMTASFMVDRQLNKLDKLGYNIRNVKNTEGDIEKFKDRCDDIMEYIIKSYDGILKELATPVMDTKQIISGKTIESKEYKKEKDDKEELADYIANKEYENSDKDEDNTEEAVEFSSNDSDLGLLMAFAGL